MMIIRKSTYQWLGGGDESDRTNKFTERRFKTTLESIKINPWGVSSYFNIVRSDMNQWLLWDFCFQVRAWTSQYSKIFRRRLKMIWSQMPLAWMKQANRPAGKFVDICYNKIMNSTNFVALKWKFIQMNEFLIVSFCTI